MSLEKEWKFIIKETHKDYKRTNLLRTEILFALQVLLIRLELKNYFYLKNIYLLKNFLKKP